MARATPPSHPPEELPRILWWRWRRNPLRRRTDLAQAWVAVGLLLAVLVGIPAAMFLVGDASYRHHRESARHQAATRYDTTAVLVHDAPRHPEPGSDEAKEALYPVTVRFTDAQGHVRTAKADVEPALSRGSTVRVWVDTEGRITGPPLTPEQVRDRTMACAVLAGLAVPALGAGAYGCVVRGLARHNLARWDTAWADTAPRWTASR
ncbi:hypothetical protein ACFRIC_18065 [Streptomyces sp. NPDC056738]|uniref:Rv1733c family protein n=1 Tax=Streptomyces sp. NPDC056738 TaxID=3345933 RepID=UPI0036CA7E37